MLEYPLNPLGERVAQKDGKEKAAVEAKAAEEDRAVAKEENKEARKRRRVEKAAQIEAEREDVV